MKESEFYKLGFLLTDQASEQKQMMLKVPENYVAWEVDWKERKMFPLICK